MLNEDKIKLMASISMFEKHEGKYLSLVNRYFKGDYISRNMLRSFIGYTFCWMLGFVLVLAYKAEDILAMVNLDGMREKAVWFAGAYLIGLLCYMMIAYVVYARRYEHGVRGLKVYIGKLRKLEKRYEFQNRTKELGREVRR